MAEINLPINVDLKQAEPPQAQVEVPKAPVKPGYKTTEFWVTLLSALAVFGESIHGSLPPQTAAIVGAVVTGLYTISRGLSKSGSK